MTAQDRANEILRTSELTNLEISSIPYKNTSWSYDELVIGDGLELVNGAINCTVEWGTGTTTTTEVTSMSEVDMAIQKLISHPSRDHATVYPKTAGASRLYVIPKGNPTDGIGSAIKLFLTDYVNDITNYFDFGIYVTQDSCRFNSKEWGNFGTNLPFIRSFQDENYKVLKLTLNGGKGQLVSSGTITFKQEYNNGSSTSSKNIDWNNGQKQVMTMTGNCTVSFTNPTEGIGTFMLHLKQDSAWGRNITRPSNCTWIGTEPSWSAGTANQETMVSCTFDGSTYRLSSDNFRTV